MWFILLAVVLLILRLLLLTLLKLRLLILMGVILKLLWFIRYRLLGVIINIISIRIIYVILRVLRTLENILLLFFLEAFIRIYLIVLDCILVHIKFIVVFFNLAIRTIKVQVGMTLILNVFIIKLSIIDLNLMINIIGTVTDIYILIIIIVLWIININIFLLIMFIWIKTIQRIIFGSSEFIFWYFLRL